MAFRGDRTIKVLRDLDIEAGARISIDGGTLHLDVERDIDIRDAEILVGPTGRLVIRAGRRLRIDDAFVGDPAGREDSGIDAGMLPPESAAVAGRVVLTARPVDENIDAGVGFFVPPPLFFFRL